MSRKIVCDRCGKDITALPKLGFIGVSFRDPETGELLEENPLATMDYCPDCMDQIKAFITAAPGPVPDSGPGPAQDPQPEVETAPVVTPDEVEELAAKLKCDFEDEEPEPKPEPAPKKEPAKKVVDKRPKGVDKGKIAALRKAGWTIQAIADEMKIGTTTVSYHLGRMGMA